MTNIDENINNISDLTRILQDNPEWRDIIRSILLGDELLKLPGMMAELVSTVKAMNDRLERVETTVVELQGSVAELQGSVARLDDRVGRLEERFDKMDGRMERLEDRMDQMDGRMERLEAGQSRLEAGQEVLTSRLGNLIGSDYERHVARFAPRRLTHRLGIRRARVIHGRTAPDQNRILDLADNAAEAGTISDQEAEDLSMTDLILLGTNPEGGDVYVVCETSVTVYDHDVQRANRRAQIVGKAAGAQAHAAVIGQSAPPETLALAERENVLFLEVPGMDLMETGADPGNSTSG